MKPSTNTGEPHFGRFEGDVVHVDKGEPNEGYKEQEDEAGFKPALDDEGHCLKERKSHKERE